MYNLKIVFINYHKIFIQRLDGNNKSPNQNLLTYIKVINKFSKKAYLIDEAKITRNKKICLPAPDNVHLNYKGVKIYNDVVSNFLRKKDFMKKKLKAAIVGYGHIAKNFHVPAIIRSKKFEISAVCEINKKIE